MPIGEWVLRAACTEAAKWPSEVRVAVNLSPVQFRTPNLYEVVTDALSQSGLAADRLELEITESALLSNQDSTVLRHLRALGVRIAMDDFGTGHSSLSYLSPSPSTRSRSIAASSMTLRAKRIAGPSSAPFRNWPSALESKRPRKESRRKRNSTT